MSAAEMVGRLLERYALSMEEIELREARCVQVQIPLVAKSADQLMDASPRSPGFATVKSGFLATQAA